MLKRNNFMILDKCSTMGMIVEWVIWEIWEDLEEEEWVTWEVTHLRLLEVKG
jgi:hypothetical protein